MPQCVLCDSTTDLNTQLTIKLDDGTRVTVDVCDAHEDVTVKSAKEAYLVKQDKIKSVLEQAKLLGLDISSFTTTPSGIVIPPQSKPTKVSDPTNKPAQIIIDELVGDDVVDTASVDSKSANFANIKSTNVSVESYAGLKSSNDILPPEVLKGKAKIAMVEGRAGVPIAIQERRIDGTGTTVIKVSKTEDDNKLQQRFKRLADDSRNDSAVDFRHGYDAATLVCPICHGECQVMNGKQLISCPKCNGLGIISTY